MKTKNYIYILVCILIMSVNTSCDDFGNVNTDPQNAKEDQMDYKQMFTGSQVFVSGRDWADWRNNLIYCSTMMQHLSTVQGYWAGDKYTYDAGYNAAYFDSYDSGIKKVMSVHNAWKDNANFFNEFQMVRIIRVIQLHRMTDMYGDVPYSEAGLGHIAHIYYPKYDKQEDIYKDMLKELEESATNLDENKPSNIGNADIMHKGDVKAWKRTAYSLMLRLGMRLSKVNPDLAKEWVQKAYAGGVIVDNSQNCIIEHEAKTDDAANAVGKVLCYLDPNASRVSQTFIDMLRNTGDPRLPYIATVCYKPGSSALDSDYQRGDTTATVQIGMPNGYDQLGGDTDISKASNYPGDDVVNGKVVRPGIDKYSVVNRHTYSRLDAPTFVITNAENQLLLAEAAYRGWISSDAKTFYEAGVRAAMEQFTQFKNPDININSAKINAYLSKNAYNQAKALEQINTQYWIATFCDEYETFANWRRSSYPALTPINYRGNVTNGTIPRRFTYRQDEGTVNEKNYLEAVSRLEGGDNMTSRVWWDK